MRNEVVLKNILVWAMCNEWFPWQPIANLRMGGFLQNTHISVVIYHRILNSLPNLSLDKGLLPPCCKKFSNP